MVRPYQPRFQQHVLGRHVLLMDTSFSVDTSKIAYLIMANLILSSTHRHLLYPTRVDNSQFQGQCTLGFLSAQEVFVTIHNANSALE